MASIKWFPIAKDQRSDVVKMITRAKINLNDYQANVGNLLIDNTEGFSSEISGNRILPYQNSMWNAITFELSRTRIEYTRTVYSTLDFLGDIGGLFGALGPMFFIGVKVLQFKGLYMFLMSDMLLNDPKMAP